MSRLTRDGTAEPVSRDQILRHARGQGNVHFPCSADHEQDWQPYPVDPYSAICDDHAYIHTYIHTYKDRSDGYLTSASPAQRPRTSGRSKVEPPDCSAHTVIYLSHCCHDDQPLTGCHTPRRGNPAKPIFTHDASLCWSLWCSRRFLLKNIRI